MVGRSRDLTRLRAPLCPPFDQNLASGDEERTFKLRTAEIKHSRLAMVAVFGFAVQAGTTGTGSLLANLELLNK